MNDVVYTYGGLVPVTIGNQLLPAGQINLETATQNFAAARWQSNPGPNPSISVDALLAPDGTATAEQATITAGNPMSLFSASPQTQLLASTQYTSSIYLKAITTAQWLLIRILDVNSNGNRFWFDILNGVTGSTTTGPGGTPYNSVSSTIQNALNGYFRCIMTYTRLSQAGDNTFDFIASSADAVSGGAAIGTQYGIWGLQTQLGAVASAYEPHG